MLRDAAMDALAAREQQQDQQRADEVDAMVAAARDLFDATMRTPDDTLPVVAADLDVAHTDLANGLTILTDGRTSLAIQKGKIRLATWARGWVGKGKPLESLADLGEVLP